jgi:hypothetical protein
VEDVEHARCGDDATKELQEELIDVHIFRNPELSRFKLQSKQKAMRQAEGTRWTRKDPEPANPTRASMEPESKSANAMAQDFPTKNDQLQWSGSINTCNRCA